MVSYGTTQNYAYHGELLRHGATSSDGVPLQRRTGRNGVFADGRPARFPTASYKSANYWVDVSFDSAAAATTHR